MKTEIGAAEAKTKLPELRRQVQAGKQFTITNRGKAVADLVPSLAERPKDAAAAVDRFLAFTSSHRVRTHPAIKARIE